MSWGLRQMWDGMGWVDRINLVSGFGLGLEEYEWSFEDYIEFYLKLGFYMSILLKLVSKIMLIKRDKF